MSFILNALKGWGSSFLNKAGGWIMSKARPIISTVGNSISRIFGGSPETK